MWPSVRTPWKSGTWQTSHRRRTEAGSRASAITSASRGEGGERALVVGVAHAHEARAGRLALEAAEQGERREEVELVACARRGASRGAKRWLLDGVDEPPVEGAELGGGGEVAVPHVAAGAARDLADLGRA